MLIMFGKKKELRDSYEYEYEEYEEEDEDERSGAPLPLRVIGVLLVAVIGALCTCVFLSAKWMLKTWNGLTMDELMFHINSPVEGTNSDLIVSWIVSCGIATVVVAIVIIALYIILRKSPLAKRIETYVIFLVSAAMVTFTLLNVSDTLSVTDYVENKQTYSSFIDEHYVDPASVEISFPDQKRNLICIYLESMEVTYTDETVGGAFPQNLIPELTQISMENENFSGSEAVLNGGSSMPGATWTMAALFGTTSGLPLTIPVERNSMNKQDTFMPALVNLGDILYEAGYKQEFLCGSDAAFGGRKLYFQSHGDYEMRDYNYYSDNGGIPLGHRVWWGFEDFYLMDFAKQELTTLAAGSEPFNLTMLTVDTHFEDGWKCKDCPETFGKNKYANVMACSSVKVAELIEWIQQQPWYENTTIVVTGDHPTMDSDFCNDVPDTYNRKVYTAYINAAVEPERDEYREYTTFDDFPTILASIGVEIEGDKLGLGTNLFSDELTLSEEFGNTVLAEEVQKNSELMDKLTEGIDVNKATVKEGTTRADNKANSWVERYQPGTHILYAYINAIETDTAYEDIMVYVKGEDYDGSQWYSGEMTDAVTYGFQINMADFEYTPGRYDVQFYAIGTDGSTTLLATETGYYSGD